MVCSIAQAFLCFVSFLAQNTGTLAFFGCARKRLAENGFGDRRYAESTFESHFAARQIRRLTHRDRTHLMNSGAAELRGVDAGVTPRGVRYSGISTQSANSSVAASVVPARCFSNDSQH